MPSRIPFSAETDTPAMAASFFSGSPDRISEGERLISTSPRLERGDGGFTRASKARSFTTPLQEPRQCKQEPSAARPPTGHAGSTHRQRGRHSQVKGPPVPAGGLRADGVR
ncbi:hypothetical protein MRX96_032186 [Rhipicephalus microplus]